MDKAEKGSLSKLTDEEILAVPTLYRSTLSALSVARETSLDQGLIDYLETLSARAYFFVYGSRSTLQDRLAAFFRTDWPAAVRGLWRETLVSGALMLLGALVAAWLVSAEPEWFYAFVPGELSGGRDPAALFFAPLLMGEGRRLAITSLDAEHQFNRLNLTATL